MPHQTSFHTAPRLRPGCHTSEHLGRGRGTDHTHLGGPCPRGSGQGVGYILAWDVWQPVPTPLTVVERMDATVLLSLILLLLFLVSIFALLRNLHNLFTLEATSNAGAVLFLDGENPRFSDLAAAILRRTIRIQLRKDVDSNISLPCQAYESADSPHSLDPLIWDWEEVAGAATSATREVIRHFEFVRGSDEDVRLYLFIQCVTLSTVLQLFFQLPTTSANIEDIVWIASNAWRTDGEEPTADLNYLSRLVKPSPNPSRMITLLSTIQRLILGSICTLEHRGENIQFIRRAGTLLRHPSTPDPDVIRLVEGVKQSHPPIQSVHGRLSLRCFPFHQACGMGFFIPVDSLPHPACRPGPDGACISWLHKAALPGPPACGGDKWLVRATAVILAAIETGIRDARLTVDGDKHDPEAWEEWVLRRLRVG